MTSIAPNSPFGRAIAARQQSQDRTVMGDQPGVDAPSVSGANVADVAAAGGPGGLPPIPDIVRSYMQADERPPVPTSLPPNYPNAPRPKVAEPAPRGKVGKPTRRAGQTYTVRRGDSLSTIAARTGNTWQQLYWRNRATIAHPDRIRPGQVLIVPPRDYVVPAFTYKPARPIAQQPAPASRPAKPNRPSKPAKPAQPTKPAKPAPAKPDKPSKPSRPDKPDATDRPPVQAPPSRPQPPADGGSPTPAPTPAPAPNPAPTNPGSDTEGNEGAAPPVAQPPSTTPAAPPPPPPGAGDPNALPPAALPG